MFSPELRPGDEYIRCNGRLQAENVGGGAAQGEASEAGVAQTPAEPRTAASAADVPTSKPADEKEREDKSRAGTDEAAKCENTASPPVIGGSSAATGSSPEAGGADAAAAPGPFFGKTFGVGNSGGFGGGFGGGFASLAGPNHIHRCGLWCGLRCPP